MFTLVTGIASTLKAGKLQSLPRRRQNENGKNVSFEILASERSGMKSWLFSLFMFLSTCLSLNFLMCQMEALSISGMAVQIRRRNEAQC